MRIGIDIGGTFTDLQILDDEAGRTFEYKTPTTPADPSIGLLTGLKEAATAFDFPLDAVSLLLHGTTIATNAVLERKLGRGALIATAGFEDVLEIGRHVRRDVFGLHAEERRLLIPRSRRYGVHERISATGEVLTPLNVEDVRRCAREIDQEGLEVVAVCLLNSYANPTHEQQIRDIIREVAPRLGISLSSEVSPEIREYERSSTTALNALLMPVVRSYMEKLQRRMAAERLRSRILLIQSNGGTSGPATAGEHPARLLLSGPCGGTLALEHLARTLDEPNLVGMDIGGTSCDISVVQGGRSTMITEGFVDGCSVRLPMVDIRTIGAGGGSIAWVEPTGRMRVGPQSAGAAPGPACYGKGGTEPTVTDANLVLGRLDAGRFLSGAMALDAARARAAIEQRLCERLGLGLEAAADGILQILVSSMVGAIRLSLFERGLDPQDFALVSFGGAGGLHAALVVGELGIGRVIYPRSASTLSALGILWSDVVHDVSRTRILPAVAASVADLQKVAAELIDDGARMLEADDIPVAQRRFELSLDLRYRGQGFELAVPLPEAAITAKGLSDAVAQFHALHRQRFSHGDPADPVETVAVRLAARGVLAKPPMQPYSADGTRAASTTRRIFLDGAWRAVPIHDRAAMIIGEPIAGPAVIEEDYTTIVVPTGWAVEMVATGDLIGRHE